MNSSLRSKEPPDQEVLSSSVSPLIKLYLQQNLAGLFIYVSQQIVWFVHLFNPFEIGAIYFQVTERSSLEKLPG
jgi:hypothetical protein